MARGSLTTGKLNAVRAAFKAGVQAVRNRKAIWNFAIRCQEGTGAGHASRSLIWLLLVNHKIGS